MTAPRAWTAEEDALLRRAVAEHGESPGVWKTIAESIPGRTNKACRKVRACGVVVRLMLTCHDSAGFTPCRLASERCCERIEYPAEFV
jgi:hypothetical protein